MEAKDEINSTFFLAFAGQMVTITTSLNANVNFAEANSSIDSIFIVYEGILLDYDDRYLYLGKTPDQIDQAVNVDVIANIMVKEETNILKEILEGMPDPTNEEIN